MPVRGGRCTSATEGDEHAPGRERGREKPPSGGTDARDEGGALWPLPDIPEPGKDPHGTFPFQLFGKGGLGGGRCTEGWRGGVCV